MSLVNDILRRLFDLLLYPLRGLPALVGLALLALVTAVAMLLVYRAVSDQPGLEAVKRRIAASLFEIRLFNDDFRHILRAQADILRHNLTYLRLSLVPMLVVLPPLVLVVAQLQFHYGYRGLDAGEKTILELELGEGWEGTRTLPVSASGKPQARLELPAGLVAETPPVWVPSERTLSWRLRARPPGSSGAAGTAGGKRGEIALLLGDERLEKGFPENGVRVRRSPVRPQRSFVDQLLYPAEPPLPAASPAEEIRVSLPSAAVDVFGWEIRETAGIPAWMIVYFVLTVVFAFMLRKPMGVEI